MTDPTSWTPDPESGVFNFASVDDAKRAEEVFNRILRESFENGRKVGAAEVRREDVDGERYRWLRDKSLGQFKHPIVVTQQKVERGMQYIGPLVGEPLDKAIDQARSDTSEERT